MQGFMVKYNLSVNRGGDFSDEPQGADLARQKTLEVPLQHNYYLQVPKYAAKRKVVGVKMEYQLYTRTIAAKRESYAQALCAAFSFGCNPTNGSLVYIEWFTLRG